MKDYWKLPWKLALFLLYCIVSVFAAIGVIEFTTWTATPELNAPRCEVLLKKLTTTPADGG